MWIYLKISINAVKNQQCQNVQLLDFPLNNESLINTRTLGSTGLWAYKPVNLGTTLTK